MMVWASTSSIFIATVPPQFWSGEDNTQDFDVQISSFIASRLQVKKFRDSWEKVSDHEKPQHDDQIEKGDAVHGVVMIL